MVTVIGTATVVVAGVLLYTSRDHDGPTPGTGSRPTTSEAHPTPSASEVGPTAISGNGKATSTGPNPEGEPAVAELGGYVSDEVTGRYLEGVDLSLKDYRDVYGKTPTCRTDAEGRFQFRDLPASPQPLKRVRLVARKEGYEQSDEYTSLGQEDLPVTLKPATSPEHHQ